MDSGSYYGFTDGPAETIVLSVDDEEVSEQVTATPPTATVATTAGAGDAFATAVLAARQNGISDLKELATRGCALLFTFIKRVLFSPPKDEDAWMTRVVLAEQWWTRERQAGLIDYTDPNGLNLLNVSVSMYAFWSAYRRQSRQAAFAGIRFNGPEILVRRCTGSTV